MISKRRSWRAQKKKKVPTIEDVDELIELYCDKAMLKERAVVSSCILTSSAAEQDVAWNKSCKKWRWWWASSYISASLYRPSHKSNLYSFSGKIPRQMSHFCWYCCWNGCPMKPFLHFSTLTQFSSFGVGFMSFHRQTMMIIGNPNRINSLLSWAVGLLG